MVGSELCERLRGRGAGVIALGRDNLDITDADQVSWMVERSAPDVIVNCAAYTNVDGCESERELAFAVNGEGAGNLARAAAAGSVLLLHLSTDFVFDGSSREPYEHDDETAPVSVYGESKLAGEREVLGAGERAVVLRTSWVFGTRGNNFVEAIARQVESGRDELRVVSDQIGRPTYVPHLVDAVVAMVDSAIADDQIRGVFHYADVPQTSWYDFAVAIVDEMEALGMLGDGIDVLPVSSEEFPRPARRPAWSVLSTRRYEDATGLDPQPWRLGLADYFTRRAMEDGGQEPGARSRGPAGD